MYLLINNIQNLAIAALALLIAVLSLWKDPHRKLNRKFAFFLVNVCCWAVAVLLTRNAGTPAQAVFWAAIFPLGVRLCSPAFLDFCLEILELRARKWTVVRYSAYASGMVFWALSQTRLFYRTATRYEFGYVTQAGFLHSAWTVSAWIIIALTCYLILRSYFRADNFLKHRLKYFFFAAFIFTAFSVINTLPMYGVNIFPFGNLGQILGLGILAYAAIENRLIDINVIISETLLLLATQSAIIIGFTYVIFTLSLDDSPYFPLMIVAAVPGFLAFSIYLAEKAYPLISRRMESTFPVAYSFRAELPGKLKVLLDDCQHLDRSLEQVFGTAGARVLPADGPLLASLPAAEIARHFSAHDLLVVDELKSNSQLRAALQKENIYLMIPLKIFNSEQPSVLGYLVLDLSVRDRIYRKEDFELLRAFSYSVALIYYFGLVFAKSEREKTALAEALASEKQKAEAMAMRFDATREKYQHSLEEEKMKRLVWQMELKTIIGDILKPDELMAKCQTLSTKINDPETGGKTDILAGVNIVKKN